MESVDESLRGMTILEYMEMAENVKQQRKLHRQQRNLVCYDEKRKMMNLNDLGLDCDLRNRSCIYWIDAERIKDPLDFFKFALHISRKLWCTPQMLADLFEEWSEYLEPENFNL